MEEFDFSDSFNYNEAAMSGMAAGLVHFSQDYGVITWLINAVFWVVGLWIFVHCLFKAAELGSDPSGGMGSGKSPMKYLITSFFGIALMTLPNFIGATLNTFSPYEMQPSAMAYADYAQAESDPFKATLYAVMGLFSLIGRFAIGRSLYTAWAASVQPTGDHQQLWKAVALFVGGAILMIIQTVIDALSGSFGNTTGTFSTQLDL